MHHVWDTKFWPHLPCTPYIFVHTDPDGVPGIGGIAVALPEQPVVERLQWTRRARHWLHRSSTSRTASGQEAAVDPPWQALVASHLYFQNSQ